MNTDINVMTDKNSLPVVLKGTPHAPDALAKIYWMKTTGDVYVDPSNLPAVPSGKQYQLWAIVDGKPVDAGMISTQKGIYHIQKMKSFGRAEAFAITLEKAGGSPTPSMDQMFVISKI
jgi:anti-sigma-K factor RskA